jgi:ABC-type anion transport system duplicated permease subunit
MMIKAKKKTIYIISIAAVVAAIAIILLMLVLSIFSSVAAKDYAIDVDPIKDEQNLFSTARVTVTNTGKQPLTNIVINYGRDGGSSDNSKNIEKIDSLAPGAKIILSPPENSPLKSVTVTVPDQDVSITKDYRTPIKIPGMMGS